MGAAKNFTDFKTDFYAKVKDFSLFDCAEFNVLKIVLDGLKVNYISRGKVTVDLFKPVWVQHLKYQLKAAKEGKISLSTNDILQFKNRKILIADDGRIIHDECKKPHSYYFSNIIKHFGKENCTHLVEKVRDESLARNLDYPLVYELFIHQKYNDDELKIRQSIITTFNNIKAAQIFDEKEIQNIAFAFQNFFNQYKVWSRLLNFYRQKYFIRSVIITMKEGHWLLNEKAFSILNCNMV